MNKKNKKCESKDEPAEKNFRCKLCYRLFTANGLGGHMSRAHPNQSEEYRKKKETRMSRELTLVCLREAQKIYRQRYGCPKLKSVKMDRTKLKTIRNEVREKLEAKKRFKKAQAKLNDKMGSE